MKATIKALQQDVINGDVDSLDLQDIIELAAALSDSLSRRETDRFARCTEALIEAKSTIS